MSEGGRWFRVNTTWSQSEWLAVLSPAARLAWIELLGYVKAHGFDGRVKSVTRNVFGRRYNIPVDDVGEMIEAAKKDGALVLDADKWVIPGWKLHQGDTTAAERVRRYRESQKTPTAPPAVTGVTRNARNVTVLTPSRAPAPALSQKDLKEQQIKRERAHASRRCPPDWQPSEMHQALAIEHGASLQSEVEKFRDHTFRDAKSDWDATFRNWLRRIEAPSSNGAQPADTQDYKPSTHFQGFNG